MDKKTQMFRNLNPIPEAIFAMYHWHNEYAAQGGGSMDFFDALPEHEKDYCKRAVKAITGKIYA